MGIGYATHLLHIPDGLSPGEGRDRRRVARDSPLGIGMLYYEDGTWGMTTFGVAKVEPPENFAEMCDLADQILPVNIAARDPPG